MLYDKLLTLENLPPPTSEEKPLSYDVANEYLNEIYLLPFTDTKEVKLAMFQHKSIPPHPVFSVTLIVETDGICLFAVHMRLPFGISSKVGILL